MVLCRVFQGMYFNQEKIMATGMTNISCRLGVQITFDTAIGTHPRFFIHISPPFPPNGEFARLGRKLRYRLENRRKLKKTQYKRKEKKREQQQPQNESEYMNSI